MNDAPILICYDGSPGAVRAIASAATLLGPRRAVVLDKILDGSLSHQVAEHAGRPVLIVPPAHDER